jgi:quercetin dioxygenase-like cupin family protein
MSIPQTSATGITCVRPAEMDWEPLGTHGLRRKLLSRDPATGATTALVDIPVGWRGGGVAHFHHAFEEVFMLAGAVTVGGSHYWRAGDYFYRPAEVVHGHDEKSPEGARALIRADGPLELLLVHEPAEPDEYSLGEIIDPRGHVLHVTTSEVMAQADPDFPAAWRVKPLSTDSVSGARTVMIEVPAGWTADGTSLRNAAWEAAVLHGSLNSREARFEAGDFATGPSGVEVFGITASPKGCILLLWLGARSR